MWIATHIVQDFDAPLCILLVLQIRDKMPPLLIRQDLEQDLNGVTFVFNVDDILPKKPVIFGHRWHLGEGRMCRRWALGRKQG